MTSDFQVPRHIELISNITVVVDIEMGTTILIIVFSKFLISFFFAFPFNRTASTTPAPKSNASKSGSQSPPELAKSPPVMSPPYLALPTNPIVIIPYSLIRGASVLPGPL